MSLEHYSKEGDWKVFYHNQVYKSLDTRYVLSQMQSVEQQPLKAWNIAR